MSVNSELLWRGLGATICAAALGLISASCTNARAGVGMPTTLIYGNYTTPLTVNRPDGPPQRAGQRPSIPDRPSAQDSNGDPSAERPARDRDLDPGSLSPRRAPQIPGGIAIPENLVETRIRTYRINLIPRGVSNLIGIPGIPTLDPLSIGWGDMSANAMFEEGGYDEWIYADANQLDILGVYTKVTIIGYGVVEGQSVPTPSTQSEPATHDAGLE